MKKKLTQLGNNLKKSKFDVAVVIGVIEESDGISVSIDHTNNMPEDHFIQLLRQVANKLEREMTTVSHKPLGPL